MGRDVGHADMAAETTRVSGHFPRPASGGPLEAEELCKRQSSDRLVRPHDHPVIGCRGTLPDCIEKDTKTHRICHIALDDATAELLTMHQTRYCERMTLLEVPDVVAGEGGRYPVGGVPEASASLSNMPVVSVASSAMPAGSFAAGVGRLVGREVRVFIGWLNVGCGCGERGVVGAWSAVNRPGMSGGAIRWKDPSHGTSLAVPGRVV